MSTGIAGRVEFLAFPFGPHRVCSWRLGLSERLAQDRRSRPELFPVWRAWCFLGGLFALWIAVASPLDTLDGLLLTAT